MSKIMWMLVACLVVECWAVSDVEARGFRRGRWRSASVTTYSQEYSQSFSGDANAVCHQKASIMASQCWMRHLGGSFGGGNYEGVGRGETAVAALNICCYTGQRTCIGQAVVQGPDGQWYACKSYW